MSKRKPKRRPSPPRDVVASVAMRRLAAAGYDGETPPLIQLDRAAANDALKLEPGDDKAPRLRLVSGWQPASMLARGLITPRQHDAALRLMEDFDAAGFDRIKGQSWGEVVDGGGAPSSDVPLVTLRRRQRVGDILRAMPPLVREVVEAVVLAGRTVETAGASLKAVWLPASAQLRTVSARGFLCIGLEQAADLYGIF